MALKKLAERQRENARERGVGLHELTHHGGDHAVGDTGGKHSRPLADSLSRGPHAAGHAVTRATKKREGERLVHQAADLTPARGKKQTKVHQPRKPAAPDASADVRRRPPTSGESGQRLIDRIDIAITETGIKAAQVARAIGIQPQGFTNMRRKANAGMHHELIAKLADVLACDLYWLLTGKGGVYVSATEGAATRNFSRLTLEIARWIEELGDDDQLRAWAIVAQIRQGHWPSFKVTVDALGAHEKSPPAGGTK